ncbi:unnamed protein product [Cyprideis torosa]|uniref:Uncharacterized protein n=1 Tax=Cyprideis torosa TaxID=163714 RepID=A0A7R8WMH2_9CRUS|nr:unnamed protein product [Cyprideis torosa]CAG0902785.1 unnamed protein product [Cyprideis torosa]
MVTSGSFGNRNFVSIGHHLLILFPLFLPNLYFGHELMFFLREQFMPDISLCFVSHFHCEVMHIVTRVSPLVLIVTSITEFIPAKSLMSAASVTRDSNVLRI